METERSHLDDRLLTAAACVRPGKVVADIGCDHGKLAIHLAKEGKNPRIIGADLRPEPLARAAGNLKKAGCEEKVELRLGDGLTVLAPGEAQDIILAGMGAQTIIQLLEAAPWVMDPEIRLILVPATKHTLLRLWLARQGFVLDWDIPVRAAGRLYAVMNARYTGEKREPELDWCIAGQTSGPLAGEYLAGQLVKLRKYCRGVKDPVRLKQLEGLLARLEERL